MEDNKELKELIDKLKQQAGKVAFRSFSSFDMQMGFLSPLQNLIDMDETMKLNNIIEKLERRQRGELPRYCFSTDEIELIKKYSK